MEAVSSRRVFKVMGLFILPSGVVHVGNIVNEATTHLEVAKMVSQSDRKEYLTLDSGSGVRPKAIQNPDVSPAKGILVPI